MDTSSKKGINLILLALAIVFLIAIIIAVVAFSKDSSPTVRIIDDVADDDTETTLPDGTEDQDENDSDSDEGADSDTDSDTDVDDDTEVDSDDNTSDSETAVAARTVPSQTQTVRVADTDSKDVKDDDKKVVAAPTCGLTISSLAKNQEVTFPITVSGKISTTTEDSECSWDVHSEVSGTAELYFYDSVTEDLDEDERWKIIGTSTALAISNWQATTSNFSVTFNPSGEVVLENRTQLRVVLTEEVLTEDEDPDTRTLPLVLNYNLNSPYDCGFRITSITQDDIVNFPVTVKGDINNTDLNNRYCSWNTTQGTGGTAQVYYKSGDDLFILGSSTPIKLANPESTKTTFSVKLDFDNEGVGLPLGSELTLIFIEENPNGVRRPDTFELPIVLGTKKIEE